MRILALALSSLLLAACATPATLMRSEPALSGTFPGRHAALARCALRALENHYAVAWGYDLREHPGEDRTELVVRAFGTDTILVAEFAGLGDGSTRLTIWQQWGVLYDPKSVVWDAAGRCGAGRG